MRKCRSACGGDGDVGGGWAPAVSWLGAFFFFFSDLVNFKILMISLMLNANADVYFNC
jgi:hypothetical protein